MVLVCVAHRARTHAHLRSKKRFGVNVLAADQRAISEYYARATRVHQRAEQEAGAKFDRTALGTPVLHGALAYLECRLNTAQDAGDHTIFIADVEDVVVREGEPLLYFRAKYHAFGGHDCRNGYPHQRTSGMRTGTRTRLAIWSLVTAARRKPSAIQRGD